MRDAVQQVRDVCLNRVSEPPVSSSLSRYGEALFMNSKLISGVTEFLNTEKELNEVQTHKHGPGDPGGNCHVYLLIYWKCLRMSI